MEDGPFDPTCFPQQTSISSARASRRKATGDHQVAYVAETGAFRFPHSANQSAILDAPPRELRALCCRRPDQVCDALAWRSWLIHNHLQVGSPSGSAIWLPSDRTRYTHHWRHLQSLRQSPCGAYCRRGYSARRKSLFALCTLLAKHGPA